MENLQEIFVEEYNTLLTKYIEEIYNYLIEETGETNKYKIEKIKEKYYQEYKKITKKGQPNNEFKSDTFTHFLIVAYYTNIRNYKDNNIRFFIKNHLQAVKNEYKDVLHVYPENYNLSEEGIVRMISKYKFFENFTSTLYELQEIIDINEKSAEVCIKLIRNNSKLEYALNQDKTNNNEDAYLNYFNKNCYELFEYLITNYEETGKIKYINIYYFLKELAKTKVELYRFNIKISEYKKMINDKHNVLIKKFAKAEYKYDDKEKPKLIDMEKAFRKSKELKTT